MAYGVSAHLGLSAQTAFGTATSSFEFIPIVSESLTTAIEQLTEEGLRGRFEEGNTLEGLLTVEGEIVIEPSPIMFGHVLRGLTGIASGTISTSHYVWTYNPPQSDYATTTALPPYTLELHRDVGSSWQFTDAIFNSMTLEVTGNAIVKATIGVMAKVSSLAEKNTPTFLTEPSYLWSSTSVSIAGAANADMESLTFTWENNIEGVDLLDATNLWSKFKRTGFRNFNLSGVLNYDAQTEYNVFRVGSQERIVINIAGTAINSGINSELTIDIPSFRYTSFPINADGPGRISASWEGIAKYNAGSATAIEITLTNTRANYVP